MKKNILYISAAFLALNSCSFLDPLENGSYNEDNYREYPKIIRGFVDKAYNLRPSTYYANEFIGSDAAADNAVYRVQNEGMRLFSLGGGNISSNPFSSVWTRSYEAINYCNLFLEDNLGLNTHYLLDAESDMALRRSLQGDAYALRAWYHYDLLRVFGGMDENGELLGVPIMTVPSRIEDADPASVSRASFDDTVRQILEDCDSAYAYLPLNNRDYPGDKSYATPVLGSVRYRCFDQVAIDGLRAMTWLLWASPAFNPEGDKERYRNAAFYASRVIRHKLDKESQLGFDPMAAFNWGDINSPEIVLPTNVGTSAIEDKFYPQGFGGDAFLVPTQDLVDAFPMANGYPISDSRSGYDPARPYEGRDPRFYATIYYDGAQIIRNTNSEVMYIFETSSGSKDAPGQVSTSPSGYYVKKFTYRGYNPYDASPIRGYRSVFLMRWEQMCLIFAEAACNVGSPLQSSEFGLSARDALAYLRSRTTSDGMSGLGKDSDPYLNECAASSERFMELVRNEWRIVTCFEGTRYFNLRRWSRPEDLSSLNVAVHGAVVSPDGSFRTVELEKRDFPSLWNPLPSSEIRKCAKLQQNAGWDNWK